MNPLDYFSDPDRGIMGIIIVTMAAVFIGFVKFALDREKEYKTEIRSRDAVIESLQEKLLTRADAYATKQEAMAEKTTTTIAQLNEIFRNGSKGN